MMIWKVTGWPLQIYRFTLLIAGFISTYYDSNTFLAISILFGLVGFQFHNGKRIFWTVGYKNYETWIHLSLVWLIIGLLIGGLIRYGKSSLTGAP